MSVYVDKPFNTEVLKNRNWRYNQACHMWADTVEELVELAKRIGLRKSWMQMRDRFPMHHFDLTVTKRRAAIAAGAQEASLREHMVARRQRKKLGGRDGVCCSCGYTGENETPCPEREDGIHCRCWWDGEAEGYSDGR